MKVVSLSLSDAWSFAKKSPGRFEFDPKITTIIGKNNTGKSNALSALVWALNSIGVKDEFSFPRKDTYDYGKDEMVAEPEIKLGLSISEEEILEFLNEREDFEKDREKFESVSKDFAEIQEVSYSFHSRGSNAVKLKMDWNPVKKGPSGSPMPVFSQNKVRIFGDWLNTRIAKSVILLDCWRSLGSELPGGKTILPILHAMQGPDSNNPRLIRDFEKIETLFADLTGLQGARLRTRSDGGQLNVSYRERYLPIESFGSGLVHTLLLAIEFVRRKNCFFLIEEPETHLHPELIRQLIRVIRSDANANQFFITSHAPVLLDGLDGQRIYCIEYESDYSTVKRCDHDGQGRRI